MKKLTVIFLLMATAAIYAQDNLTQTSINGMLTYNQGQVIQLAQAFSEEQYDWRPTDGVVSVREALLHVASANYYLTSKLGFAPPENVDMMKIGEITGRDNVIAALKQSNEFVLENIIKIGTSTMTGGAKKLSAARLVDQKRHRIAPRIARLTARHNLRIRSERSQAAKAAKAAA